jgi:hypothetical protein
MLIFVLVAVCSELFKLCGAVGSVALILLEKPVLGPALGNQLVGSEARLRQSRL